MFKLNFLSKSADTAGSKKSKKEFLLLAVLVYAAFLRFLLPSDFKKIKSLNDERLVKRNELSKNKMEFFAIEETLKNPQKFEEEYSQAEEVLNSLKEKTGRLKDTLAKKELLAEVLNYLTSGAKEGELEFNLITASSLVSLPYFNELPVKMKITADFHSLSKYIQTLESLPVLVDVKQMKLSSPDSSGILNAEADLVVYVSP